MAKTKNYDIEVLCSTIINVSVKAEDLDHAMGEAEYQAGREFLRRLLNNEYKLEDFYFEAQTP